MCSLFHRRRITVNYNKNDFYKNRSHYLPYQYNIQKTQFPPGRPSEASLGFVLSGFAEGSTSPIESLLANSGRSHGDVFNFLTLSVTNREIRAEDSLPDTLDQPVTYSAAMTREFDRPELLHCCASGKLTPPV